MKICWNLVNIHMVFSYIYIYDHIVFSDIPMLRKSSFWLPMWKKEKKINKKEKKKKSFMMDAAVFVGKG